MKIRKATFRERKNYNGLNPLHATATVRGHTLYIEELNESNGGPKYEVILPEGYVDGIENLHSFLCFDKSDLEDRLKYMVPVAKETDDERKD